MTKSGPHAVVLILALLGLFFSVGDLIGDTRLAAIEQCWRHAALRLLRRWTDSMAVSTAWVLVLIRYGIVVTFCAAVVALRVYVEALVFAQSSWSSLLLTDFFGAGVTVTAIVIAANSAHRFIQATIAYSPNLLSADHHFLPIEVRLSRRMLLPLGRVAYTIDRGSFRIGAFAALYIVLPVVGALLPPLFALAIMIRILAATTMIVAWMVLLGPSLLLHWLSTITGATSYFKFGKYLVLTASAVWLLWQWWGR